MCLCTLALVLFRHIIRANSDKTNTVAPPPFVHPLTPVSLRLGLKCGKICANTALPLPRPSILSHQFHYDWGLRAVKSVLLMAGKLKRSDPGIDEEAVLMRALRDFNTPKVRCYKILLEDAYISKCCSKSQSHF